MLASNSVRNISSIINYINYTYNLHISTVLGSVISKHSKDSAAKLCTFAVRYHGHLRNLQAKCRTKFKRFLDSSKEPLSDNKRNPLCYYYNSVYGTTSWRKPYCLRNTNLRPNICTDLAATKIQGVYKMFSARILLVKLTKTQYAKIFDRVNGNYYYAFNGKSVLLPKQTWKRPLICGKKGFNGIQDISVSYTIDISAIKIQNRWRCVLVRSFIFLPYLCDFYFIPSF